jgi:hypothetical protein
LSYIRFEKLSGPIYPAYLVVCEYSIALEPDLIKALTEIVNEDTATFFEKLLQKVGTNRYLKEMIEEGISKEGEAATLAKRLQGEIRSL